MVKYGSILEPITQTSSYISFQIPIRKRKRKREPNPNRKERAHGLNGVDWRAKSHNI